MLKFQIQQILLKVIGPPLESVPSIRDLGAGGPINSLKRRASGASSCQRMTPSMSQIEILGRPNLLAGDRPEAKTPTLSLHQNKLRKLVRDD